MERHNPSIAKTILVMKNKEGGVLCLIWRLTTVTGIETVWCWGSDRHTIQWNRKESPERGQHKYARLFLRKI